ncbi:MAG: hypothetical protein ACOX2W_12880 [Desulfomonilia bacterium]
MPEKEGFILDLPSDMEHLRAAITDEMRRYIFKNRVVNARDRRELKYNKRVELNEDFKALWQKISKKTRYSVEFETAGLIESAAQKIQRMEKIQPVSILIDKTEVDLTQAGVEAGMVRESRVEYAPRSQIPPGYLGLDLQRETELTRGTLVEIFESLRSDQGVFNKPAGIHDRDSQAYHRALHEMVIDGIKYELVEGQVYEMSSLRKER